MNQKAGELRVWAVAFLTAVAGCTRISHVPVCPPEAAVGQAISINANVTNPGATPRFLWEVIPNGAGTFAEERSVSTTFTPTETGRLTLRLSAADGLFSYVNQCTVQVSETADLAVTFTADPTEVEVGDEVALLCSSTGGEPAVAFSITQTAGDSVDVVSPFPGVGRFDAETAGALTFQCVGESAGGVESAPATVTITVTEGGRDTR